MKNERYKILVVDDTDADREALVGILRGDYDILEATSGEEAIAIIEKYHSEIEIILLDAVLKGMDGFDILTVLNNKGWIKTIPVIMVSSDSTPYFMRRAYGLGATDYISKPYDSVIVRHRIMNTIMLYSKQKKLVSMLVKQIYQRENNANLMANVLGHIVEFRSGKSGSHVLNVGVVTKILLESLNANSKKYHFTHDEILLISTAATLHDIGKISIPEEIAYKRTKLTDEEFEIMKNHSVAGVCILEEMKSFQNEPLIKMAHDVCRWHHERYDGKGYPDGLVGDDIPIAAQVVGMADVYDVLTSERVYKDAVSHEKAIEMILNGECGCFNPELLECLKDNADSIHMELKLNPLSRNVDREIHTTMENFFGRDDAYVVEQILGEFNNH